MKTKINVTREMINRATPRDCENCMVTIGVEAVLNRCYRASTTSIDIAIYQGERRVFTAPTPGHIKYLIAAHDRFETVQPFTFELDLPAEILA